MNDRPCMVGSGPLAPVSAALVSLGLGLCLALQPLASLAEPLPSWKDGPSKRAILQFVQRATGNGNGEAGAIPTAERIAVFDNDGTLWSEQPLYIPFLFCIDRIRQLAPANPGWRGQEPYASALRGDLPALLRQGHGALTTLLLASSSGMTSEAFSAEVRRWIATARHPLTGKPYTDLVFQPMLELLAYLRSRGFRTYIVSGGDAAFLRPWSEAVYGIPPEQVIGTRLQLAYRETPGGPVLDRLPVVDALVDGPGKPVAIEQIIGRRPVAAFGNSDGDRQMLTWTMAGPGPRFALLVHHTDGRREWAYDRLSPIGRLNLALDQARRQGWTVVDMAREWRVIHPLTPPVLEPAERLPAGAAPR
jgi:phosphoserine phosphatase